MANQTLKSCSSDLVVSLLKSQTNVLTGIIRMIEDNEINSEIIDENLKQVERDVRWLRSSCF